MKTTAEREQELAERLAAHEARYPRPSNWDPFAGLPGDGRDPEPMKGQDHDET